MDNLDIYARLRALSTLDDPDFEIACSANPELQMICNGTFKPGHQKQFNHLTDFLYMIRSEYLFGKELLKYQKEEGLMWKKFYERMTYLYANIKDDEITNTMAINGRLMELKILKEINKLPNQEGANLAAWHGHLEVLKWMKENNLPLPDQQGANWAAQNGHLEVLKWMKENNLPLPDQYSANWAAQNGHLEVLKWMRENNLVLPDRDGANWAAEYGHLEVLKWMKENNLPFPTQYGAILAAAMDHEEVLSWLASQNPPILPN